MSMLITDLINAQTVFLIFLIIKSKQVFIKNRKFKSYNLELRILQISKIMLFFSTVFNKDLRITTRAGINYILKKRENIKAHRFVIHGQSGLV